MLIIQVEFKYNVGEKINHFEMEREEIAMT